MPLSQAVREKVAKKNKIPVDDVIYTPEAIKIFNKDPTYFFRARKRGLKCYPFNGKYFFSKTEIIKFMEEVPNKKTSVPEKRVDLYDFQKAGGKELFYKREIELLFKISKNVFAYYENIGVLPKPKRLKGLAYHKKEDILKMMEMINKNRAARRVFYMFQKHLQEIKPKLLNRTVGC